MFEELFTSPLSFFGKVKSKKISALDIIISALIVVIASTSNIATVLYLKQTVNIRFIIYILLIPIPMWFLFSYILHLIANVFSLRKYKRFQNTLFAIGISRTPLLIFVFLQFIILAVKKVNAIPAQFLTVYIIVILWMFYLYLSCLNEFYELSFGRSVLVLVLTFVIIIFITTLVNSVLNIRVIYF
jgi:hypothetical protein